jgi:hypothetical protein
MAANVDNGDVAVEAIDDLKAENNRLKSSVDIREVLVRNYRAADAEHRYLEKVFVQSFSGKSA